MKTRIYTDTSVLGGCEDAEFAEHSVRLMDGFVKGLSNDRDPDATGGDVR